MLRGKYIASWRRPLVALAAAACITIGFARLLYRDGGVTTQPDASVEAVDVAGQLDNEVLQAPAAVQAAPAPVTISLTLDRTEPAAVYLQEAGLDRDAARQWQSEFAAAAKIQSFVKGHVLTLARDPETGDLRSFTYNVDDRVEVSEKTYGDGVFRSSQNLIRYVLRPVAVTFRVKNNFVADAGRHDLPQPIIETLDYAFRDNLPQNRVPRGSAVKLIYQERVSRDGTTHFATGIEAAMISFGGKTLTAFAFRDENGQARLYDSRGVALGPYSLRFPLNFDYISSGFSFHRYHPILHIYREHTGIDLAARYGTPVKAVADGTIAEAGWCGELGRCVRIQHDQGLVSIYGHLSRIEPGIEPGRAVRVGEEIGQVGTSGLSTGPHLHYAIEKDGQYVNPLYEDLGSRHHVSPRLRALFDRFKQSYLAALDRLPLAGHPTIESAAADKEAPVGHSEAVLGRVSPPAPALHAVAQQSAPKIDGVRRTAALLEGRNSVLR